MKRSDDRILTTHTGSLPRPKALEDLMYAKLDGEPYEEEDLQRAIRDAVYEVVQRQSSIGIDTSSLSAALKKSGCPTLTFAISGMPMLRK